MGLDAFTKILRLMGALVLVALTGSSSPGATSADPLQGEPGDIIVLVFVSIDCPISNRYAPTVNALVRNYSRPGVRFHAVYSDSQITASQVTGHRKAFGYTLPEVIDADFQLARKAAVSVTPEAAVFILEKTSAAPSLVYRGRIDDRYLTIARARPEATQHDLQEVLAQLLEGKKPRSARPKP